MPDFDFSTLITDRSQADVDALESLLALPLSDWTAEQLAAFNQAISKGAYNYTDLNRVTACVDYLAGVFQSLGYQVPGYKKVEIPRSTSRLPDGYTELAYIQSSGTQYIDTGVKANTQTRVQAKMRYAVAPSGSAWAALFGSRNGSGNQEYWVYYRPDDSAFSLKYGNDTSNYTVPGSPEELNNFSVNGNTLSVNGQSVTANLDALESKNSFYIFAVNNSGSLQYASKSALYQFTVYSKSERVRDFVPCTNPSGTVGLYDLINGEFYGNAGTGDFIAGPEPVELPDGYTQVEYIESSGTQYIDTGIPVSSNLGVVCECDLAPKISPAWLFGSREGTYVNTFNFVTVNGEYRSDYGNENVGTPFSISAGTRFSLSKIGPVTKVDGVVMDTESTQTFASATPLYIFANNNNGEVQGRCTAKLFYLQMLEGGKLLRDFIPCVDPDGSVGLYDAVEGGFYGNSGTGAFTAGPDVPNIEDPPTNPSLDPYTWYDTDVPTQAALAQYLTNVQSLMDVLTNATYTVDLPADMALMTYVEANNIEEILTEINTYLEALTKCFIRSGMSWATAGSPGFYFAN